MCHAYHLRTAALSQYALTAFSTAPTSRFCSSLRCCSGVYSLNRTCAPFQRCGTFVLGSPLIGNTSLVTSTLAALSTCSTASATWFDVARLAVRSASSTAARASSDSGTVRGTASANRPARDVKSRGGSVAGSCRYLASVGCTRSNSARSTIVNV